MADEKILVEIVLDDGSVQKGFARIQKEAAATEKKVSSDFENIGENINQSGLDNFVTQLKAIPAQFGLITAAAAAAGFALKQAFDLALAGERLAAVDSQFNRLTESAGISAQALRAGFESAADGLVDIDNVIATTNEALVNLGSSAQRLPEVLELTRRVTATLGGDIQERFDGIVRAIDTANTRSLRQQGIIIDQEQAFRSFAQSIGVATNELTLAQRQQAILNAVIEQGNKQFANVSTSVQPLTDAFSRLKTAIGELGDTSATVTNQQFGAIFTRALESITLGLSRLNAEITGNRPLEVLRSDLARITPELIQLTNASREFGANLDYSLQVRLKQLQEQEQAILKAIAEQTRAARLAQEAAQLDQLVQAQTGGQDTGITQEQIQARANREAQINQLAQQGVQFRIQLLQQELQTTTDLEAQRDIQAQIRDEQIKLAAEALKNDLLAIEQKFSADLGFSDEQREQARLARVQNFNAQIELLNQQSNTKFLQSAIQLQNQLRSVVVSGLSQTAAGIGAALARGENAFKAFADGAIGIVADLIITIGNALIQQGIAIEFFAQAINTPLPGAGLTAAAKGLALVLFGSALKAAVGSRGTGLTTPPTPVVTTTPTGEFTPSPTAPTELTPTAEVERRADTSVVVNISGDVLDSDETGSRIISLINDAFDKKGVKVRRGVTA
jgi:hypothetical protein